MKTPTFRHCINLHEKRELKEGKIELILAAADMDLKVAHTHRVTMLVRDWDLLLMIWLISSVCLFLL